MDDERGIRMGQWSNWNKQREVEKNIENMGLNQPENKNDYLAELTYKIAEKALSRPQNNPKDVILEKKVCKEVEGNTCAICFELMVPPNYSPILLFPCGHTFCKSCTLISGSNKLKILKCPVCRQQIQSHAVNISLQNLICTFTNQKNILDQEEQSNISLQNKNQSTNNNNDYDTSYKLYELRCQILLEEKKGINNEISKLKDELATQETLIESFKMKRQQYLEAIAKIQLFNIKCNITRSLLNEVNEQLQENLDSVENIQEQLQGANEKKRLIDDTLKPLQQEMQKYKILSGK